jgi:undecaprenyl-diphosphatase
VLTISAPEIPVTLVQLAVIALIQGLTEFLPISSSGHLILIPSVTGWQDQGLVIDVAVHVGTLGAVMAYLWRDIWTMLKGLCKPGNVRRNPGLKLMAHLIIATVPVVIVGGLVFTHVGDMLRSAVVVGWATIGFGVLLYIADRFTVTINRIEHMTWGRALIIGIAQVFALIPGASRAGTTITMARWLGFERTDAARFSMLMSIPAILAAGGAATLKLIEDDAQHVLADAIVAGAMAFVAAFIAIVLMMSWLRTASFTPFVIYRLFLGVAILVWAYN